MKPVLPSILCCALLVLAVPAPALADSVIVGQVVSAASQKPVTEVVVTATSPSLQGEKVVVTDAQGQYRIPQLPPGVYSLRFEKESFEPFTRVDIQVRLDRTRRVNVELSPEGYVAEAKIVKHFCMDLESTTAGVNVDQDFIKRSKKDAPRSSQADGLERGGLVPSQSESSRDSAPAPGPAVPARPPEPRAPDRLPGSAPERTEAPEG